MSLRDTITGATKEAREATASLSKKETSEETERPSYSAFGRKSAATAKPVREAAASVRVSGSGSGSSAPKSKEEKRAARARQREREDIRSRGFEAMLRADPDYHRAERVWWVFLGLGFVATIITLVLSYMVPESRDLNTVVGMISAIMLVFAYFCIFGSVIYSFFKMRPLRKKIEAKVAGMTDKKLNDFYLERQAEYDRKRAERKARRK